MKSIPPVFVISLARAAERRADIARRLGADNIRHEIVDAVDGDTLDMSQLADRYSDKAAEKKFGLALTRREIGCYLSHYNLWRRMIDEKIPAAVILEDDARWEKDFSPVVAGIMNCEWQWDVVLLKTRTPHRRTSRIVCSLGGGYDMVQYKRIAADAAAYCITLAAAEKLAKHAWAIVKPIDVIWWDYWNWDGRFYCANPRPIYCTDEDSTIGGRQRNTAFNIFKNKYNLVRFWHWLVRRPKRKQ